MFSESASSFQAFVPMQIPELGYTMWAQPLFDFRILSKKWRACNMAINDRLSLAAVTMLEDLPEEVDLILAADEFQERTP